MTIEETWNYGKDRGKEFYSHIIGNVQYLYDQDNIILNSGATEDDDSPTGTTGRIVEVDANDPDSGEIFELEVRSEEHTSELQSRGHLVCRLLLEKKKICATAN